MIHVRDHAALAPERLASLAEELTKLSTLEHVVRWGLASSPPREVVNVVVQDELSHDVVVMGPGSLVLSFDTT
jgi:hypothetical protein